MKIAVLTTETVHHAFFVRELATHHRVVAFCESAVLPPPPFETRHAYEEERDRYEWDRWFDGKRTTITALVSTKAVETVNEPAAIAALDKAGPDVVVVFGTGRIRGPLIDRCRNRIFNLHGGDPEEYRGLDTHLWAIFHRDFAGLVTTLHRLDHGLDTGDIVYREAIPLFPAMPLHALRAANTELCVRLAHNLAAAIERAGSVASTAQARRGRYYSAMPAVLKGVCKERFERHVARIPHDS